MERAYQYRFEIFLLTQVLILFGSLAAPADLFHNLVLPLLLVLNTLAGLFMVSRRKRVFWFLTILTILSLLAFGYPIIAVHSEDLFTRYAIYFIFHIVVTKEIIKQVWNAAFVNKNVIIGLMSGYLSLGFVTFFLFSIIELATPGSFAGVFISDISQPSQTENMLYYSYVTLLTIGYGDIVPVTAIAQKASVLAGLLGQFYTVIITAVIVSKYIIHSRDEPDL